MELHDLILTNFYTSRFDLLREEWLQRIGFDISIGFWSLDGIFIQANVFTLVLHVLDLERSSVAPFLESS
jgi:hypothetical protein